MKENRYYADDGKLVSIEHLTEAGLLDWVDHYLDGEMIQSDFYDTEAGLLHRVDYYLDGKVVKSGFYDADGKLIPEPAESAPTGTDPGITEELPSTETDPAAGTDADPSA